MKLQPRSTILDGSRAGSQLLSQMTVHEGTMKKKEKMKNIIKNQEKMFFDIFHFFFFSLSPHNPSFGTITGPQDPSRIVDLGWSFILVYSLSLVAH